MFQQQMLRLKWTVAWQFLGFFWLNGYMYLGLSRNRFWFSNYKDAPFIWDSQCKFQCLSCQTFSEILRISEKDWPLSLQFSKNVYLYCKLLGDMIILLKNILKEPQTCQFLLEVKKLQEVCTPLSSVSRGTVNKKNHENWRTMGSVANPFPRF